MIAFLIFFFIIILVLLMVIATGAGSMSTEVVGKFTTNPVKIGSFGLDAYPMGPITLGQILIICIAIALVLTAFVFLTFRIPPEKKPTDRI